MAKYNVSFKATYQGYVTIEADNKEEAEEKVMNELDDAGFFLDAHTQDAEFECEAKPEEEQMDAERRMDNKISD